MRKRLFAAIVVMACVAVSCQKNEDELPTFEARTEIGSSKTELVGSIIQWVNTDQVKVFGDFGYAIYGVTPRGDNPTWATLSPIENHGITGFLPYKFVYPASVAKGGTQNNNTLNVTLPDSISILDSPTKYFPMYGESDIRDVVFTNLCGMVKVHMQANSQSIREVYISANENICGTGAVVSSNGYYILGNTTKNKLHIDMNDTSITNGVDLMFPVPVGVYSDFTITIINTQFDTCVKSAGEGVTVNVNRNEISTITLQNMNFVESHFLDTHYLLDGAIYEYPDVVDLGLPSGTKWAVSYVGTPVDIDDCEDCENVCYPTNTYNGFSSIIRNGWDAPTLSQYIELRDNCTVTYSSDPRINGITFVSKINGNSLTISPSCDAWSEGDNNEIYRFLLKSNNLNKLSMYANRYGCDDSPRFVWQHKLASSPVSVASLLLVYHD